jgi:hypothetical protein
VVLGLVSLSLVLVVVGLALLVNQLPQKQEETEVRVLLLQLLAHLSLVAVAVVEVLGMDKRQVLQELGALAVVAMEQMTAPRQVVLVPPTLAVAVELLGLTLLSQREEMAVQEL